MNCKLIIISGLQWNHNFKVKHSEIANYISKTGNIPGIHSSVAGDGGNLRTVA